MLTVVFSLDLSLQTVEMQRAMLSECYVIGLRCQISLTLKCISFKILMFVCVFYFIFFSPVKPNVAQYFITCLKTAYCSRIKIFT